MISIVNKKKIRVLNFSKEKIDITIFEYNKKTGVVLNEESSCNTIEEIPKSTIPTYICINNTKVVTKQGEHNKSSIEQLMPSVNPNNFFYNIYTNTNGTWFSFIRKDQVSKIIEQLKKFKHIIGGVFLGPYILHLLQEELKNTKIQIPEYNILFDNEIQVISKNKEELTTIAHYTIANDSYKSTSLIPLGMAIAQFSNSNTFTKNNYIAENEKLSTFVFNQKLKKFLISGSLCLVFCILLLNNFLLFNYQSKVDTLQIENQNLSSFSKRASELKKQVIRKEQLVKQLNVNIDSKSTLFIDKIISTFPISNIQLNELKYQPITKNIKKGKEINYLLNHIKISGNCTNNNTFTEWVKKLESLKLIQKINVTSFQQEKTFANFQIEITL